MEDLVGQYERLKQQYEELEHNYKRLQMRVSLNSVSGMPNQLMLKQDLDRLVAQEEARPMALIIVQLEQSFHAIQKSFKTTVIEWVLYQIAERIKDIARPDDQLYHTKEHEFILVHFFSDPQALPSFMEQLHRRIKEPHIFNGFHITTNSHIGYALYPEDSNNRTNLLQFADISLDECILRRKPLLRFTPALKEKMINRVSVHNDLVRAVEQSGKIGVQTQFDVHYQPKITLEDLKPDYAQVESVQAEALLRWYHPTRGLIPSSEFIPIAEHSGIMVHLGKWLAFETNRQLEKWSSSGLESLGISINISPRQFAEVELEEVFQDLFLDSRGHGKRSITLELTETSLFQDPAEAFEMIQTLKSMGYRISVDDFGTGYSSLSHLHRFPVDEIKIDRSFVIHICDNQQDQIIVRSLIHIAQQMGVGLVAEGVETWEQLQLLYEMGCTTFQGFLFSPALTTGALEAFMDHLSLHGNRLYPVDRG